MQNYFSNLDTISVSELTKLIKLTLEENFSEVSVVGEISNFKAHVSGHWYFNLKDANAGVGELQAAFEMLKRKLADEGLFDEIHKKPIPSFPKKIGIVTAKDGAAFQDMISVAERRFPLVEMVISPTRVQGSGAAESIVESLKLLNKQNDIDLIIVARGGGSIEDLWAFNEEIVAREIFASKIPIVTGIGHEVDFTIADFVADLRAPTPSAAMEIATPNKDDFFVFINEFSYNSSEKLEELCNENRRKVNQILNSYGFRYPIDLVRKKSQLTDNLIYKILHGIDKKFVYYKNKVLLKSKIIESQSVHKNLKKGYVIVNQDSHYVKRAVNLEQNKPALLKFFDGDVEIVKRDN